MEPLWSPVVAPGRNRSKIEQAQEPPKQANGKEGVIGSSPIEGFAKFLHIGFFCCRGRRRTAGATSTKRPPVSQVVPAPGAQTLCWRGFAALRSDVHRMSTRSRRRQGSRGAPPRARGRRGRGGRNGGRSSPSSR